MPGFSTSLHRPPTQNSECRLRHVPPHRLGSQPRGLRSRLVRRRLPLPQGSVRPGPRTQLTGAPDVDRPWHPELARPAADAMVTGVRPIMRLAADPTATTASDLVSRATTEGSEMTTPRPPTDTRVFAVPRSIAMSSANRTTQHHLPQGGPPRAPSYDRAAPLPRAAGTNHARAGHQKIPEGRSR